MTRSICSHRLLSLALLFAFSTANADGNWLVGGSVGTTHVDETVAAIPFDTNSTSLRLYGGYQFNEYFALEFGYLNIGDFDETFQFGGAPIVIGAEADGFTLSATGNLPLTDRFSLHGTIGSFFWDGETSINGISDDPGDTNFFFGAGAKFSLTSILSLRAEAARYELDEIDASIFSLGLQIDFE